MLQFFGRGSAFDLEQNSAFFTDGDDIVLIDCPMSSFHKLIRMNIEQLTETRNVRMIFVFVTHTHGDHVSGIATLIQYAYYVWHVPIVIAAPSSEVKDDLRFLFGRLEGCDMAAFHLTTADMLKVWIKDIIPTTHVPGLAGRCFGYHLCVDNKNIIYTGDTNTLEPYKQYITEDSNTYFYTEASVSKSPVHIYLPDEIDYLSALADKGVNVFLMHLDNTQKASEMIKGTGIRLAPLY